MSLQAITEPSLPQALIHQHFSQSHTPLLTNTIHQIFTTHHISQTPITKSSIYQLLYNLARTFRQGHIHQKQSQIHQLLPNLAQTFRQGHIHQKQSPITSFTHSTNHHAVNKTNSSPMS
jgi:hypothetical protein